MIASRFHIKEQELLKARGLREKQGEYSWVFTTAGMFSRNSKEMGPSSWGPMEQGWVNKLHKCNSSQEELPVMFAALEDPQDLEPHHQGSGLSCSLPWSPEALSHPCPLYNPNKSHTLLSLSFLVCKMKHTDQISGGFGSFFFFLSFFLPFFFLSEVQRKKHHCHQLKNTHRQTSQNNIDPYLKQYTDLF